MKPKMRIFDQLTKIRINDIVYQVKNWNLKNVSTIKVLLSELNDCVSDLDGDNFISDFLLLKEIPTCEIPKIPAGFKILVMDESGYCLLSEDFSIEHIDNLRS